MIASWTRSALEELRMRGRVACAGGVGTMGGRGRSVDLWVGTVGEPGRSVDGRVDKIYELGERGRRGWVGEVSERGRCVDLA